MMAVARPPEALALNNAALTALCIGRMAFWHSKDRDDSAGLAWPLVHFTLVICVHGPTRSTLPGSSMKRFAAWANEHPREIATMDARAKRLRASTMEGLRVALRQGVVELEGGLLIAPRDSVTPKELKGLGADARDCLEAAKRLGRMLAFTDPTLAYKATRMTL